MYNKAQSREVFKQVDLFGQGILLNLNGEDSYRTGAGGVFSLLIIVIVAVFFQSNIISFLAKTNITADVQTFFFENPDQIILNDESFMFALTIDQNNFTTNPYFNITLLARSYLRHQNGTLEKINTPVNLIPCTIDRFQKIFDREGHNFTEQYNSLALDTWLCPDRGYSISLKGRFTSQQFDFLKIDVTDCKSNTANNAVYTWKPKCASEDEKAKYLKSEGSFRIRIYTTNTVVNPNKPSDYVQTFLDDDMFFSFVPKALARTSDIYFLKNHLSTDHSLVPVLEEVQDQNIVVRDEFRDIVLLGGASDTSYSAFYFRRSPFTIETQRTFQKVDDLLSYLGGFANIVVVFLGFAVAFYNKQQYLIELANKVYNFDMKENSANSQYKKNAELARHITGIKRMTKKMSRSPKIYEVKESQSLMKLSKYSKNSRTSPRDEKSSMKIAQAIHETVGPSYNEQMNEFKSEFQQEQEAVIKKLGIKSRKDYLIQQIKGILNQSQPIIFTLRFLLNQLSCGLLFKTKQIELLDKAISKINQDLDIYMIIEKIKQINLLKEVVLNKDQQILFNFTPKETIRLHDEKQLPSRMDISQELKRETFMGVAKKAIKTVEDRQFSDPQLRVYYKVFKAYDRIFTPYQEPTRINLILTQKLGKELQDIFEVSQFIKFDINKGVISERVKKALKKKLQDIRLRHKEQAAEQSRDSENIDIFSIERYNLNESCNILQREINFKSHNGEKE